MADSRVRSLDRRRVLGTLGAIGTAATASALAPQAVAATYTVPPYRLDGVQNSLTATATTAEERLREAIAQLVDAGAEGTITVSEPVVLTSVLVVDCSFVSLDFTTGDVDASSITSGAAIRLIGSVANTDTLARRFVRGLRLVGPGRAAIDSIGIEFDTTGSISGVGLAGIEILGFGKAVRFGDNASGIGLMNLAIADCGIGIRFDATASGAGKNVRVIGGSIIGCDLAVSTANENAELNLTSVSIDSCARVAVSETGSIALYLSRIRMDATASTSAAFATGASTRAKIILSGGTIGFETAVTAASVFETASNGWGGGIAASGVTLQNAAAASGFLAGGTGRVKLSTMSVDDGPLGDAQRSAALIHRSSNGLIDGDFTLATSPDAYVATSDATSRSSSPGVTATVSGGNLVIRRFAAGDAIVSIDVPCTPGAVLAFWMRIVAATAGGDATVTESFVRVSGRDARNIPVSPRVESSEPRPISLAAVRAALPYVTYSDHDGWQRAAPSWATHYRWTLGLSGVTAGTISIAECVVTAQHR